MFKNYQQLKIIILALVLVGGGWYYLSSTQKVEAQLGGVNLQQIIQSIGSVANINLSNFNSVSQLSQVLRQAGSGNQTVGKISDFLDQFGDLGGSISDLTSGNLRSIGDVVNSVGQISDLAGASDILSSLGNLGATADDLLGGNGAWSGVSDMLGSLNTGAGLGNLGTVADNLDTVWTDGGSYNSMILRLRENGSDLGNIIEDPKVLSEDITPDDLLPGSGTGPGTGGSGTGQGGSNRQNPSEDSKKAEQQLKQDRKEDEEKCKAEKYNKDDLLDPKKLGGVGGGQYVPVQEQDGDLMSYTKDTNKLTGEIKDLQIQICTHLKTIKRIQLKFEEKEFVGDVKAKEKAANNLAKFQKETLQNRSEGRTRADGTTGDSFTPTPEAYAAEVAEVAKKNVTTYINKNSGNSFATQVTNILYKQEERDSKPLASTLSKEQYEQLTSPEKAIKLNGQTFWGYALLAIEPQNNPVGSFMLAKQERESAATQGATLAIQELAAGGGYAPQIKAKEKDDEGNVTKREIVSPGSTIARTVEEATLIDVVQNEQADEAADLSGVEQPSSQESTTLEPADGGPSNGGQSPGGGGFDWSTITDLVGDWGSGGGSGGGNGGGTGGTSGGFGNILELLQNLLGNLGGNSSNNNTGGNGGSTTNKPEAAIAINGPTLAELAAGRPNIINLRWGSLNASRCVATNDWLSASLIPNRVETVKTLDTSVGTSGSLVMYLPLNFDLKLLRERNGITSTIGYSTTTNPSLSQQVTTITINPSDIAVGDKFILVAQTGVNEQVQVAVQTNVASASAVNTLLNAALDSLSDSSTEGKEFRKYQFFFTVNQNGVGFITITAKASYSIRCSGSNQTANATVNLTR